MIGEQHGTDSNGEIKVEEREVNTVQRTDSEGVEGLSTVAELTTACVDQVVRAGATQRGKPAALAAAALSDSFFKSAFQIRSA